KSLMEAQSYTGTIQIFSQGGTGLAEAIDEDINYIDRKADRPRDIYKGPDVDYSSSGIEKQFLEIYNFDFSSQKMLCDAADPEQCSIIQIND
ncbi:MAG TPA: Asp/Glu/hydantoin racemase, partial [Saprospirales bacterium]|nr:Asp/Glu/hydantoin racemase [Saprospirales bacterium]